MEAKSRNDIEAIARILGEKSRRIVIIPHINPDGDAIGSVYGLAVALKNAGHSGIIITPNSAPGFLNWLSGEVPIVNYLYRKKQTAEMILNAEVIFCVDFNDIQRTGDMADTIALATGVKVMIDHHPFPKEFCDYMVSEPDYSSSAELVFDFLELAGFGNHINEKVAASLYTGIMTDTGSFSHNTSRANLYRVLSALMTYGINTEQIHERVYHNFSADRLRLMGYCLHEKMVILPEYRTGYIALTSDELKKYNFVPGDTEGFVNIPLSISNIVFSVLFVEKEGHVKASFRSKGSFPANRFSSEHFGGGGHLNAAGGEIKLTLDETIDRFRQLLPDYRHLLENS